MVQDTDFSSKLPVGEGILPFSDMEEAVAAIGEVQADFKKHAKAARAIAEDFFDSDKILNDLIDQASTFTTLTSAKDTAP